MVSLLNPGYSEDQSLCVKSFQRQKATIKFGFYFSNIKKGKKNGNGSRHQTTETQGQKHMLLVKGQLHPGY